MNADTNFQSIGKSPNKPLTVSLLPFRQVGDTLYVSGQVATREGELITTGLVGNHVDMTIAQECAWQCAINVLTTVKNAVGSLDKIDYVVRLGVYVASADGFNEQHLVAHGASQLILDVLGPEIGKHCRTAIGVKSLPLNSPVEVDAIFQLKA